MQRWGILRSAFPRGITLTKTTATVLALAKLHNFCIDQKDNNIPSMTDADELRMVSNGTGSVSLVHEEINAVHDGTSGDGTAETRIPRELIGAGDHFDDVPREIRETRRREYSDIRLPRERLAEDYVRENNYQRPRPRGAGG